MLYALINDNVGVSDKTNYACILLITGSPGSYIVGMVDLNRVRDNNVVVFEDPCIVRQKEVTTGTRGTSVRIETSVADYAPSVRLGTKVSIRLDPYQGVMKCPPAYREYYGQWVDKKGGGQQEDEGATHSPPSLIP